MKFIHLFIFLTMLVVSPWQILAEWTDVGRYKEISTGIVGAYKGYLAKDGKSYYFKDNINVYKLSVETGKVDVLVKLSEIGESVAFDKYALSDDERFLFYCDNTLVKYDIRDKNTTRMNETILGIKDANQDSSRYLHYSINSIYYHKYKVILFIDVFNKISPTMSTEYGLMEVYSSDAFSKIASNQSGKLAQFMHTDNMDTCYFLSKTKSNFHGNQNGAAYLDCFDMNSFNNVSNHCYDIAYNGPVETKKYPTSSNYYGNDILNFLPKSNLFVSYFSNNFNFYRYDTELVKKIYSAGVVSYQTDFSEAGTILSYTTKRDVDFFSFDLKKKIDNIALSNSFNEKITRLVRLHENFAFLAFDEKGTIGKSKFKIDSLFAVKVNVKNSFESINEPITFTAINSVELDSIRWKFSDGQEFLGKEISRSFDKVGYYDLELAIWKFGEKKQLNLANVVNIRPELKADFEYRFANKNKTVCKFINKSIGNISNVEWAFSDGTKSYEFSPTISFNKAGIISVKLTIWDGTLKKEIEKKNIVEVLYSNYKDFYLADTFVSELPSQSIEIIDAQSIDNDNLLVAYIDLGNSNKGTVAIFNIPNKELKPIYVTLPYPYNYINFMKREDTLYLFDGTIRQILSFDGERLNNYRDVPFHVPYGVQVYNDAFSLHAIGKHYYFGNSFNYHNTLRTFQIPNSNVQHIRTEIFPDFSAVSFYLNKNILYFSEHPIKNNYIDIHSNQKYDFSVSKFRNIIDLDFVYSFINTGYILKINKKAELEKEGAVGFFPADVLHLNNQFYCLREFNLNNVVIDVFNKDLLLTERLLCPFTKDSGKSISFYQSKILLMPDSSIFVLGCSNYKLVYYRLNRLNKYAGDFYPPDLDEIKKSIFLAPNPASDILNVALALTEPSKVSIDVFDLQGRKVLPLFDGDLDTFENIQTYNIAALHKGVYILYVNINGKPHTAKFIKSE